MGQRSDYVTAPYMGVSQVPEASRLRGSCKLMEDCMVTIPMGLQKRPPYEWMRQVLTTQGSIEDHANLIPRGTVGDELLLIIHRDASNQVVPKLTRLDDGASLGPTVSSAASAYLNSGTGVVGDDIRSLAVEDTVFITNRKVKVGKTTDTAPTRPYEALIWVKASGYGRTTAVTVASTAGGAAVTYSTSTGGNAADASGVGTDRIARGLYNGTVQPGSSVALTGTPLNTLTANGFTVQLLGSIIYLAHPTVDFQVAVSDDQGGSAVVAIKESVQRFSDLPSLAIEGFTVEVAQAAQGGNSNYFVRFTSNATTAGVWEETVEPGAALGLDPETMPVGIFYDETLGSWQCDVLPWKQRTTGNETLAPDPPFVGDYIQDVKWFNERLALISLGSPYRLSATDSPYKFYPTTLATTLDTDSVGYLNPLPQKAFFQEAVSFDTRLVSFGSGSPTGVQAVLSSNPGTAALSSNGLAKAVYSPLTPLQGTTGKVMFGVERPTSTAIMDLAVDRVSGLSIPQEGTAAVPGYVAKGVNRAATQETDYLTWWARNGTSEVYVRAYRVADNQQVQNGWHRWHLPIGYTVVGMMTANGYLYTVAHRTDTQALHLLRQVVTPTETDLDSPVRTYLDRRVTDAQCTLDTDPDASYVYLPTGYEITDDDGVCLVVRAPGTEQFPTGYLIPYEGLAGGTALLFPDMDLTGVPYYVGYRYGSRAIPNKWYVRGQDDNPLREGRLTLRHLKAELYRSSTLQVIVRAVGKPEKVTTWEGLVPSESQWDQAPDSTTQLYVPIGCKSTECEVEFYSDHWLGFRLSGYEWTGDWNGRSGGR